MRDIAEKIVEIVNQPTNDYDAVEESEEYLKTYKFNLSYEKYINKNKNKYETTTPNGH